MKMTIMKFIILLLSVCILTACGQKGDLYHTEGQAAFSPD